MRKVIIITASLIIAASLWSCRKIVQLPPEPVIKYIGFAVFDTTDILGNSYKGGRLKFHFEDGDGDLGLPQQTGDNPVDTINLFITAYRKTNGTLTEVLPGDLLYTRGYRIPYMDRIGQYKILRGTITISFLYQFYIPEDSAVLKYNFFVIDRALNKSNTETTAEIPLSLNGLYK